MTLHHPKPRAVVALVAALCALVAVAPASAKRTAPAGGLQQDLQQLVDPEAFPGVLASVRDRAGRVTNAVAGVGDLRTGQRPPVDGEVRIGSNTKTFTAVAVLQLVADGKVDLDAKVEEYLPGLVRGPGGDGREISVRQLLRHTSGLPNYTNFLLETGILPWIHTYFQPRAMLDKGLAQEAEFAPGTRFSYSNTNYAVLGLIVEAVTGRPIAEELERRIVQPLRLRHTYFPGVGEQELRGRHPHGYHRDDPAQPLVDVTVQDPSFGWAAGQMVSTPSEVNRFFLALLQGKLVSPALLREMQETVPADELGAGKRYGLGLVRSELPCGGEAWGHGGNIAGFTTVNAATADGRAATIALTGLPTVMEQVEAMEGAVGRALCR
ncbi:serine hydrolase [Conexibacter sp. SYSU D00693]|uniref:serine hydrolase domain-containing protein n=1 Tax=Conexibacter sp. SYSU D00693 TaxID=2812560 RepID=UPI00196B139D|nr:serine hydrolase domain-containing protein [Conexibacter sp. SYSU D00693]